MRNTDRCAIIGIIKGIGMIGMFTAADFLAKFCERVTEDKYGDIYKYDLPRFTAAVTEEIRQMIEGAGLAAQKEYFRIDVVGWQSRWEDVAAEAAVVGLNPHLWDLKIAVEHENDRADWTDELIKLLHIRCPLKVVIGYNHCDCREDLERDKLACAAGWMQLVEAFDGAAREEYLIILGNCAPRGRDVPGYERFDYRGYLWDRGQREFRRLAWYGAK